MRKFAFIHFIFLLSLTSSFAEKVTEGEIYYNTIKYVSGSPHSLTLPPGDWLLEEIEQDGSYQYLDFYNNDNQGELYIFLPNKVLSGDYFGGSIDKCEDSGDTEVLFQTIQRGGTETLFCVQEETYDDGVYLNVIIELMNTTSPLTHMRYSFYFPKQKTKKIDKRRLKEIGKILAKSIKRNSEGATGDYSLVYDFLK